MIIIIMTTAQLLPPPPTAATAVMLALGDILMPSAVTAASASRASCCGHLGSRFSVEAILNQPGDEFSEGLDFLLRAR